VEFLAFLFIVVGVVMVALWLYIVRQGDAEFDFLVDRRSEFILDELTKEKAVFSCAVPFLNKGTQDGTIMDCYPRLLMPNEYYKGCHVQSRLTLESNSRNDGYWEALIVFKTTGDAIVLTLTFTDENGKKQTANEKRLGTDFSAENVIELTQRQLEKNKAKTLVVEKEALETPPDAEKPKKRTGFVPPVEIERNRIAEISQNKPLEEQEKEKEIQTNKEDEMTLETSPKPLKNDFMFEERERNRKEKLELIAKKVGLDREGNFKTPVLFVEHADKPVRYTYLSSELKRSERSWSSEIAKENVKFDYYVSPQKKLFSAEYRKENGESLYQTCRKGADREDVSAEFEKAHTKVKQANMSKGRSKSI